MNDFFGTNLTQQDLQQRLAQRRQSGKIHQLHNRPSPQSPQPQLPQTDTQSQQQPGVKLPSSSQNDSSNLGQMNGDSLDDIIMQNTREVNRRQTSDNYHFGNAAPGQPHDRRLSMMEFSAGMGNMGPMYPSNANTAGGTAQDSNRRHSNSDISLGGNGFPNMPPISTQGLSNPLQATDALNMNTNNIYNMSPDIMNNLMNFADVDLDAMGDESDELNMFGMQNFSQQFPGSHLPGMTGDLDFTMPLTSAPGMSNLTSMTGMGNQGNGMMNMPTGNMGMTQSQLDMNNTLDGYTSPNPTAMTTIPSNQGFNPSLPVSGPPPPKQEPPSTFSGVYSSSGFDMLGALMRVATRKNPEINIGAVDMSCAFVVCDLTLDDCPIIYVSEIFERLTGYSKHEVLGRNCRFLQAPDGKVTSGMKRKYVDDESVYYLKSRISEQKEAQRSLINYRKGGQPFMNLLTMIPITWDSDEFKYIVGFQVDLVEQPSSVAGRGSGGSYTVNYSQKMLPAYVWHPPESRFQPEVGNTISRDEVSAVLSSYHKKNDSELMKRMWDKVLLENTDDVVHVLSLKGLFLYLSPASRQVLEYDPAELVGTALSSICHPSDIVPVTRELKDTTAGAPVNVVYRIRRKNSGYTWFESHGTLCVEQGKGRKCIILVGRERPVYALARHDIEAAGGIGENELWSKLSTSGMFLFVSSNVRILLDRQPEELVGTSIQAIMRAESKVEFGRTLERARTGMRTVFKHEVLNRRGQVLQAQTTLYPGDAAEGSKPTFLVCQTRLIKSSSRSSVTPLTSSNTNKSVASGHSSDHDANLSVALSGSSNLSGASNGDPGTIVTHAGGAALPIGTQEEALASEDNIFDELKTTRSTSWQFELRQMEKVNRLLSEELSSLLSNKKKRKRRKGSGNTQRDCANCHTRTTPEWRRGPSGQRDLCNSCGLRWAKQNGRVSPRNSSRTSTSDPGKHSASPVHSSPLHKEQTSATVLPATASGANTPGNASVDLTAASTSPQARSTGN